jgi:hypothetical protein
MEKSMEMFLGKETGICLCDVSSLLKQHVFHLIVQPLLFSHIVQYSVFLMITSTALGNFLLMSILESDS